MSLYQPTYITPLVEDPKFTMSPPTENGVAEQLHVLLLSSVHPLQPPRALNTSQDLQGLVAHVDVPQSQCRNSRKHLGRTQYYVPCDTHLQLRRPDQVGSQLGQVGELVKSIPEDIQVVKATIYTFVLV